MDYVASCPPTLEICSHSGRRTGHCKYAVIRASLHLRSTLGRPRSFKTLFSKKPLKLETFFWRVFALCEVATGHCKNAVIRARGHLRGILSFFKCLEKGKRKLVGVFSSFFEVATGHYKNTVIRAGGHFGGPL